MYSVPIMRHLRFFPRYYMTHADMMRLLPSRNYGVAGQAVWPTGNVASTHACIPRAKDRPILDRMMTHGTCPISVCISFNRRFHAGPATRRFVCRCRLGSSSSHRRIDRTVVRPPDGPTARSFLRSLSVHHTVRDSMHTMPMCLQGCSLSSCRGALPFLGVPASMIHRWRLDRVNSCMPPRHHHPQMPLPNLGQMAAHRNPPFWPSPSRCTIYTWREEEE
jgi:hypothetical protein